MSFYVFKIEKDRDFRLVYYTGEASYVWSPSLESAEVIPHEWQAREIARLAQAHWNAFEPKKLKPPMWYDDL